MPHMDDYRESPTAWFVELERARIAGDHIRAAAALRELKRLGQWTERYPDTPAVLTHGFPWGLFANQDKFQLPDELWGPFENPNLSLQLLFAIGLGGTWDYPLPQARQLIEDCVRRIGADRLMWGTDMPIVMRHWTYQQNIDFIVKYCDFLSKEELGLIMGGTTMRMIGLA